MKKRLVVVSGPSGVGKGPIIDWTKKLYFPDLSQVKARKTKTERHNGNEDDLGFKKNKGEYYKFDCRGVEQRIYLNELDSAIENQDVILLESYYNTLDFLKNRYEASLDFASVFISPLNLEEINDLNNQGKTLNDYLPDLMLDSLIKRAQKEGKSFTSGLVKELEKRAEDSVKEMNFAHNYKHVIPNHCHESDSRWNFPFLVGEPLDVVNSLKDIVEFGESNYAHSGQNYNF